MNLIGKARTVISCLLAAFLFFCPYLAMAGSVETPRSLEGGVIISAETARELQQNNEAEFFDMRSAVNYGKGHIPGARALPYMERSAKEVDFDAEKDGVDLSQLPADKSRTLVFYSHGTTGWKSYKAAVLTLRAGYQDVRWFRGGLQAWEKQGFSLRQY